MTHQLLRLATAGSVDDGKSTLVGRLLYDTKSILADQLEAIERVSRDRGLVAPDLALLTDGLRAEREQGITIDVAYRYFATPNRSFILADTPGHVQYTRNMVTGASTAELALILVDARNGVVEQTRRHAAISALLGIRHVALVVNKMDLVEFERPVFDAIAAEFAAYTTAHGVADVVAIPISALAGDNVVTRSDRTPWYGGPTLLEHLESVPVSSDPAEEPLRFPVQFVIRPQDPDHHDYRAYAGRVAAGTVHVGDEVSVLPSGLRSTVVGIETYDGPLLWAQAGQSVSLRLADDVDASRGDLIAGVGEAPRAVREVSATVTVVSDRPIVSGQRVLLRAGTRTVRAIVAAITDRLDVDSLERVDVDALRLNDIGDVELQLAEPVPLDAYSHVRATGAFLLIDDQTGATVAAGLARSAGVVAA
ncbi:MAG: GTP-binding protein [Candidatus Nanopelagicales bacterium]